MVLSLLQPQRWYLSIPVMTAEYHDAHVVDFTDSLSFFSKLNFEKPFWSTTHLSKTYKDQYALMDQC